MEERGGRREREKQAGDEGGRGRREGLMKGKEGERERERDSGGGGERYTERV